MLRFALPTGCPVAAPRTPCGLTLARTLVVAATSLWLTIVAASAARADITPVVVYGNLGASGTGALSDTNTVIGGTNSIKLAAAFTTGTNVRYLSIISVSLGLSTVDSNPAQATLSIYTSGTGGFPSSTLVGESSPVTISGTARYSFSRFNPNDSWFPLAPSTTYWAVITDPVKWHRASGGQTATIPIGQNSSGYVAPSLYVAAFDDQGAWGEGELNYSISIVAVPEPGTLPLVGIGLAVSGWVAVGRASRRRVRARAGAVAAASDQSSG